MGFIVFPVQGSVKVFVESETLTRKIIWLFALMMRSDQTRSKFFTWWDDKQSRCKDARWRKSRVTQGCVTSAIRFTHSSGNIWILSETFERGKVRPTSLTSTLETELASICAFCTYCCECSSRPTTTGPKKKTHRVDAWHVLWSQGLIGNLRKKWKTIVELSP